MCQQIPNHFEIYFPLGCEQKLLVIADHKSVGFLPGGHEVFKIEKMACISLSVESEQDIELKVSPVLVICNC